MNIVIYTQPNCPNCVSAKQLLKSRGMAFEEVDAQRLSQDAREVLFGPGVRQMPQILVNGQRVGGLAGLQAALRIIEGGL